MMEATANVDTIRIAQVGASVWGIVSLAHRHHPHPLILVPGPHAARTELDVIVDRVVGDRLRIVHLRGAALAYQVDDPPVLHVADPLALPIEAPAAA